MSLIATIFAGFISGVLAKWIMPGKQKAGFLKTTLLGVLGALVGNFAFNQSLLGDFSLKGLFFSTIGALVVLFIYGIIKK